MSAVQPPSFSEGELPVPEESRVVNSDEIHVTDSCDDDKVLDASGSFDPQF